MQIIFGKYTIPFKTYSSRQLGFDDHFTEDVRIRVVQDCAHLFFIPCFGMGKDYFYRQNEVYHPLPHDLVLRLQAQENIRTPVFAYALPLLILLATSILLINGVIQHAHRTHIAKKVFFDYFEKTSYALDHLGTHHVIKLKNPSYGYGSPSEFLQVINIDDQSIECRLLESFDYRLGKSYTLAKAFQNPSRTFPTIQISKQDLAKAICRNASKYIKGYRPAIELLQDGYPYYVESITYLDGPEILVSHNWNPRSPDQLELILENTGFSATLINIRNKKGNIAWTSPLPQLLPGGYVDNNNVSITGTCSNNQSNYEFLLTLEDSLGLQHTFSVASSMDNMKVTRIY